MIFVTGAGGNVGQAVLDGCKVLGLPAVGGDRGGALNRRFDFEDRSTWGPALEGCTALFLLRPPPISDVKTTLNPFVDFARAHGVGPVVFLSVQGADTNTRVPHHEVEQHLIRAGGAYTLLRPGFFAQNFASAYRADLLEDRRLYLPAAQGTVAFVDVRDLGLLAAKIFAEPARHAGQGYLLTGPRCFTFDDAARILTELTGRPIRYVPASIAGYLWHLVVRRRLALMQGIVQTVLHVGLRHGDAALVDPTLEQLLGQPARPLDQYLREHAALW